MSRGRFISDSGVRNLCIMPALGLLIAFNVFPLLASLGISFTDFNPIIDNSPRFVGLQTLSGSRWRCFCAAVSGAGACSRPLC